ncbi:MAG: hypothetical protein ABJ004_10520 [Cyclobacteriaceae bacterium]
MKTFLILAFFSVLVFSCHDEEVNPPLDSVKTNTISNADDPQYVVKSDGIIYDN